MGAPIRSHNSPTLNWILFKHTVAFHLLHCHQCCWHYFIRIFPFGLVWIVLFVIPWMAQHRLRPNFAMRLIWRLKLYLAGLRSCLQRFRVLYWLTNRWPSDYVEAIKEWKRKRWNRGRQRQESTSTESRSRFYGNSQFVKRGTRICRFWFSDQSKCKGWIVQVMSEVASKRNYDATRRST